VVGESRCRSRDNDPAQPGPGPQRYPRAAERYPITAAVLICESPEVRKSQYYHYMPDPRPLSAVGLRLAGEVGQATLSRVVTESAAVRADLDQHVAAVRAAITECQSARGREASAVARHAAVDARVGPTACAGLGELLSATTRACPDVPFVADACSQEPSPPLPLLLHYLCGFVEEAVTRDWWPAAGRDSLPIDWESMRIAAVCMLISAAEAESDLGPDLHSRP
jgi:hypothetical protein